AGGEAGLVRQELDRLEHDRVQVGGLQAAARVAHELEQASGDLLAAVSLFLDQTEVMAEVGVLRQRALIDRPQLSLERLGAARDRRERIVQLVCDPRSEPARRREPLREKHLALEPLRARDVLYPDDR